MASRSLAVMFRVVLGTAMLCAIGAPLLSVDRAAAEERKFLIFLANMQRSFVATGGLPCQGEGEECPSLEDVNRAYFRINPDDGFGSFAEYWDEVSYGIVRIDGKALGIVELPWPQYPILANIQTTVEDVEDGTIDTTWSPSTASNGVGYFDLNSTGDFQYGEGERVRENPGELTVDPLYKTDSNSSAASAAEVNAQYPGPQSRRSGFDNVTTLTTEDLDGDGRLDFGVEDIDNDGRFDLIFEDRNGNCILDFAVSEDCTCPLGNCNGIWEPALGEDCNGNGFEDVTSEDEDNDNHLDVGEDTNCNGLLDAGEDLNYDGLLSTNEDLDNDGNHDLINEDADTSCELPLTPSTCCVCNEECEDNPPPAVCDACGEGAGCGPCEQVLPTECEIDGGIGETPPCCPSPSGYFATLDYTAVWTPGERFRDIDGDGAYDALFEPAVIFDTTDADDATNCYNNMNGAMIEPRQYVDINNNDRRDLPEPLEDFIVRRVSNTPGVPQFALVDTDYIGFNYPGNVPMVLDRIGNNIYDSPDRWDDIAVTTPGPGETNPRKLEQDTEQPTLVSPVTPEPSWFREFWAARYGVTSANDPVLAWQTEIPQMLEYTPPTDDEGEFTAGSTELNFSPNRGGTGGWGTVFEQMLHIRPAFAAHIEQGTVGAPLSSPYSATSESDPTPVGYIACPPSETLDPENLPVCSSASFNYNCTEHTVGWLDEEALEPIIVRLNDDVLHSLSLNGYTGCIDPGAATMRPFLDPDGPKKQPEAVDPCDFDGDGAPDSFVFTDMPPYVGDTFGPLLDIDGNDTPDIIFTHPIGEANEPPPGQPECSTGEFAGNCLCIDFDVDPANPFNEQCCPGGGLVPDDGCGENIEAVDCFVPECDSRYCPIPRFMAPTSDDPTMTPDALGCLITFNRRYGDGTLPDLEDDQAWPGWSQADPTDNILPPANLTYDGPKEYDDLASSLYHTKWSTNVGALGDRADDAPIAGDINGDGVDDQVFNLNYGGDLALGEVTTTSPFEVDRNYYGHDQGGFQPTVIFPDTYIVPAGPMAGGDTAFFLDGALLQNFDCQIDPISGSPGFDGGNVFNLEFMTWRTDGSAPTEPLDPSLSTIGYDGGNNLNANEGRGGFRDYNLDGMLDLGEGRAFGTDNYVIDSLNGTRNDGMDDLAYPHNRTRLTEDVIEHMDFSEDYDIWINEGVGCVSTPGIAHMVILPPGLPATDPFAVTAPNTISFNTIDDNELGTKGACDLPVRAELIDMVHMTSFTNLAASLDRNGESNNEDVDNGGSLLSAFAAHEFGHYWECWPDLYDYDVFAEGELTIEQPIGRWDLMAGSGSGLVHVIPLFKQNSGWIQAIDLRTRLTPGVPQTINLSPIELVGNSYYFYERDLASVDSSRFERFYFFHLQDQGEFSSNLPWNELAGAFSTCGDGSAPGGVKPGGMVMLHTDLAANQEGLAPQQRLGSHFTYLYEQADGVHGLETPLQFGGDGGDAGDPFPGICDTTVMNASTNPDNTWWASGESQPVDSGIELLDIVLEGGGSSPTFLWFPQEIPTLRFLQPPNGQSIGNRFPVIVRWSDINAGTGLRLFAQPVTEVTLDDRGACTDGRCYDSTLATVTPTTIPKATPGNSSNEIPVPVGIGGLDDGLYRFFAFLDPAFNSPGVDDIDEKAHTIPIFSDVLRRQVVNLEIESVVLDFANPNSARLEGWTATYAGDNRWEVCGSLSGLQTDDGSYVPCEDAEDFTGAKRYWITGVPEETSSPAGAVKFVITTDGPEFIADPPDRFTFATTGYTPYSAPIEVINGQVDPGPIAVIERTSNQEGCPNMCFPGVRIEYDGSDSIDSNGLPDGLIQYRWDIGSDNGVNDPPDAVGQTLSLQYDDPGTFSVTLTVVEGGTNRSGQATVTTTILNRPPVAEFTVAPDAGPAPLLVTLDASDSFDPEGDTPLNYTWDFDYDGQNFAPDLGPTAQPQIERSFAEGSWTVALRVTDSMGNNSTLVTHTIDSGNRAPQAVFEATPSSGTAPLTVVFDATDSSDPDGDTLSYSWNFGDESDSATGETVIHTYQTTGLFQATLEVDDGNGAMSNASQVIQVILGSGNTITADMTATPLIGESPLRVSFTAIASDTHGEVLSYRWDFKDGNLGFGREVTHVYRNETSDDVTYNPVLVVSDPNGTQATATRTVVVQPEGDNPDGPDGPQSPDLILVFGVADDSMLRGTAPLNVLFDTRGSRAINGAELSSIEVQFGDGTSRTQPAPGLVSHTYFVENGATTEYTATATMIGTDGARKTDTLSIQVFGSQPPVATLSVEPTSGVIPLAITADATGSLDPEGTPLSYMWNMGDGSAPRFGLVVNHTYNEVGTYVIELTVTDSTGAFDTATSSPIVASPAPPTDGGPGLPDPGEPEQPEPPDENPCGIGCGVTGAGQLLFMLMGLFGIRSLRRRR